MVNPKIDEVHSWLKKAQQDLEDQETGDALNLAREVVGFILNHLPKEALIP